MRHLPNLTTHQAGAITVIGLVMALALVGFLHWTPLVVQAQPQPPGSQPPSDPPQFGTLTTRALTPEEIRARSAGRPRRAPSTGPLTDADVTRPKGAVVVELEIGNTNNAIRYHIERRLAFSDGSETLWQPWMIFTPPGPTDRQVVGATDEDGAPGFRYQYRAYKETLTAKEWVKDSSDGAMAMSEQAYGYGTATGVVIHILEQKDPDDDDDDVPLWRHRVTRYTSRDATEVGYVLEGGVTHLAKIPDTVEPGIYRYIVEHVKDVAGVWEQQEETEVIVKVDGSVLSALDGLLITHGVRPGPANVTWNAMRGIHHANFAMYEVVKRNAKTRLEIPYSGVGVSLTTTLHDKRFQVHKNYEYAVRAVAWDESKGHLSMSMVSPFISVPSCNNSDVPNLVVKEVQLGDVDAPPANTNYTFNVVTQGEVEGVVNDASCAPSMDDFYVERRVLYKHSLSASCGAESCDVVGGTSGVAATEWTNNLPGEWKTDEDTVTTTDDNGVVTSATMTVPAWYDNEFQFEPGLYRHEYRLCSYYAPALCGSYTGLWKFVSVPEIPFK